MILKCAKSIWLFREREEGLQLFENESAGCGVRGHEEAHDDDEDAT
jgi:hypothetical protein